MTMEIDRGGLNSKSVQCFFFSQFNETILFANFTDVNSMIGMSGAMALLSLQSN